MNLTDTGLAQPCPVHLESGHHRLLVEKLRVNSRPNIEWSASIQFRTSPFNFWSEMAETDFSGPLEESVASGPDITWNFGTVLIDRNGPVAG
jgi:glutathione peroxidase-family protein